MKNTTPYTASVKVMRSYDYCHFEVILGSTEPVDLAYVDAMRKEAARLADKAVAQYKVARGNADKVLSEKINRDSLKARVERTRQLAEGDRTVSQQAELKAYDDESWAASRCYDYEDDWAADPSDY